MRALYANIINETQKIILKKKTIVLFVISGIIPVAAAIVLSILQRDMGISPVSIESFPVFILGIFTNLLLPLFICMAAVDMFAGEYADKTLKITLIRPITRFKVYLSKISAIGVYIVFNLGVLFCISTVSTLILAGINGFERGFIQALTAYCVAFAPMMLLGTASALISQFTKSGSGALTVSIIIFIALKTAAVILPSISGILFTSYTDWHLLWLGGTAAIGRIGNVFMFILSYCIIFLAGGFYLFDRKEL